MKNKQPFNPVLFFPPFIAILLISFINFIPLLLDARQLNQDLLIYIEGLFPGLIIGSTLFFAVVLVEWRRYKGLKQKEAPYLISGLFSILIIPFLFLGLIFLNNYYWRMNWFAAISIYLFLASAVLFIIQIAQKKIIHWEELNGRQTLKISLSNRK
jgi:fatty acid desaturase